MERQEARIERVTRELVAARGPGRTICPSEVARAVGGTDWRPLMGPVREVAWRLQAGGELEVTQRGRPVERESLRGPIRLGLPRRSRAER